MVSLDSVKTTWKLDRSRVFDSVRALGEQIGAVWADTANFDLHGLPKKIDNAVVFGMGGSALGAHIVQSLYGTELKVPFFFVSSYEIPGFVGPNTLAVFSSYSGSTEEVLRTLEECKKRNAYCLGIGVGGELGKKLGSRFFKLNPKHNPSGHPRLGSGYMTFGLMGLLHKTGLLNLTTQEISKTAVFAKQECKKLAKDGADNLYKKIAKNLHKFNIVVAASEFLAGNAHLFSNQLNESSKNFSNYFLLPELNHHLMEGLKYPESNKNNLKFILLESDLYSPRVKLRYKITKEVLNKNGIKFESLKFAAKSKLLQVVEMMVLGGFTSFYLAMLNKIDPGDVKWVDYFKTKMSK